MSRASERVVAAIRAESPGGYTEGADPVSAMLDKDVEHSRPLGGRDAFISSSVARSKGLVGAIHGASTAPPTHSSAMMAEMTVTGERVKDHHRSLSRKRAKGESPADIG